MSESIKELIKETVDMEQKVGLCVCEGFQDVDLGEIQELIDITAEEFTEELMEMRGSKPVPDDKEVVREAVPKTKLTLDNPAEGFQLFETALTSFTSWSLQ